jgi:hypothetical protein
LTLVFAGQVAEALGYGAGSETAQFLLGLFGAL